MKTFGLIVAWIVGTLVVICVFWGLGIAFGLFTVPWHAASNIVDTKHAVIDQTVNATNALYNYDWFKQQSQDITANLQKINDAKAAEVTYATRISECDSQGINCKLSAGDWSYVEQTEDARLLSVAQGLQQQQEQLVADYNAHASEADKSIFINGIIPSFFDVNKMVGGMSLGGSNN